MKQSQRHYPIEEYFLAELMSPARHEYFDGEIFVMSGGSPNHETIVVNVTAAFHAALRESPCRAFASNMRIRTPSGLYTYPDASIVCGVPDILRVQGTDTIGNPVVLVEVLSKSTVDYDRGQKFELYQSIPTFRDYVLIEQSHVAVEHRYLSDGKWLSRTAESLDDRLRLTGVDLELPLALVYERVTF
ncbi:MAG: Uma2 family endonuclease [Thermoanaerobaculia bacterium]